jgi:peroxiredoxin
VVSVLQRAARRLRARAAATFTELGINVAALSVDDQATTAALVEKLRLPFLAAYGADADHVAALTGAYVNHRPRHLQTTGFVLDPTGKIIIAVYPAAGPNTNPSGRR